MAMSQKSVFTLSTYALAVAGALLLVAAADARAAGPVATHPAMPAAFSGSTMDTDKFLVQPPASVRWTVQHANHEHPAVVAARLAPKLDSNTFIVQPPASTQWVVREQNLPLVAVVAPR
jgi:hypothetical protein